ncbi:hypothetical protein RJ641_033279 [Dillenia turbinata]|uniref:F-box domain-containing protein n=1 Tax=Dillenia turbinata TaxID=194707 RepID=A0AAN8VM09_9MAGN
MASSIDLFPTVDRGSGYGGTNILALPHDVLLTHILTRLDGPTLSSAACASSTLHSLSSDRKLWIDICESTWPSTADPRMRQLIGSFPSGHRSLFSDSFPLLAPNPDTASPIPHPGRPSNGTMELISAVDIHCKNQPIFSKVQNVETESGWFLGSPFIVDLLSPKDSIPTQIKHNDRADEDDKFLKDLEENMTLSWIVVDPNLTRSVNLSGRRPISVERHWLNGDVQLKYVTILTGDRQSPSEYVQCEIVVTCGGCEGEEMHVREVTLQVEDLEGKCLSGRDSLAILQRAMERGKREKVREGEDGKARHRNFMEMRKERTERKQRREKVIDMVCVTVMVAIFLAYWSYVLFLR